VLVSRHLMSEMALTADHLLVIGKGRLIADTSVAEFARSSSRQSVHVRSPQAAELAARCREAGATVRVGSTSRVATAHVVGTDAGTGPDVIEITGMDSAEVGRLASAHGIALAELIPIRASLEETSAARPISAVRLLLLRGDRGPPHRRFGSRHSRPPEN
jgi:ABC-2 type transport system ATP-binding protein